MSKQSKDTGKVARLRADQATKIEPSEGWKVQTHDSFLRSGSGDDDRLVRLYDVVAWLMREEELPLKKAVDAVCDAVEEIDADAIFYASDASDYAHLSNTPNPFAKFRDEAHTPASIMRAEWLMPVHELAWLVNTKGHPVAFDRDKETPFEFMGKNPSSMYAVTHRLANELWRWGRVVNQEKDVSRVELPANQPHTKKQIKWNAETLFALLKVYRETKGKLEMDKVAEITKLWGVGDTTIRNRLKQARELEDKTKGIGEKKKKANPFSGI